MRRFSQRNSLVTLNEINITPLLDLAFVLLIIFVITRPMLEQNVDLQLPKNVGAPDKHEYNRHDVALIEIKADGEYLYNGRRMTMRQVEQSLVTSHEQNPKLMVDLRADKRTQWENVIAVLDACMRNHITQFSAKTAPLGTP